MSDSARPADRFLRLFADVRAGESTTVLLLTLNIFLILTSYYLIKVVREPLILTGSKGGAEVRSYSAAGQAVLLLGAVPLYGWLASRLPRQRLIQWVTLFFLACLVGFYLLANANVPVGIPFFLWVGIFNVMVIAQFWSFANDVYTVGEGERLFPIVAFGASAGAVLGSYLAGGLARMLGITSLLLVAPGLLLAGLAITKWVDRRERLRGQLKPPVVITEETPAATGEYRIETGEFRVADLQAARAPKRENPFALVFRSRYLLYIALLILILNWVNTTGEYMVSKLVSQTAAAAAVDGIDPKQFIAQFYSNYFAVVNVVGLLIQLFLVSRILQFFGVRVALLILPLIAFSGYLLLVLYPVLAVVRWAKTAENATDYSIQNTVRNVLFLPTTREEKYQAKQAIDSFFVRAGDVLQAGTVYVGTALLGFGIPQFATFNLVLVSVWLALAVLIGKENLRLVARARGQAPA